jgi:patatin-related protein
MPSPGTPLAGAAPAGNDDYVAEIRFGVVMYGGVSLAIYINGVTNELFEMACATPRPGVLLGDHDLGSTREIFRRISYLCGNPELRRQYGERLLARGTATGEQPAEDMWDQTLEGTYARTRFVVDAISGTSAGGINGIFLAKALARGEEFAALKNMWIREGDIGLLLNDKASYRNVAGIGKAQENPASLLNSDRMYLKLLEAMQAMKPLTVLASPHPAASPLAEELDLFVTTTDIIGTAVPLRLFDKVVHERRHKQSYHFSYQCGSPGGKAHDFCIENNPFLAFAARCTSSFPFAFEPMTLHAVTRLAGGTAAIDTKQWNRFFPNLPKDEVTQAAHLHRAFGDGGYLDNKPFTYVVDVLAQRLAHLPIERKLLYVEPSPDQLNPRDLRPDPANPPNALSNSIAALTSIPLHETIREDLQAVLKRNRRIERVERIVRLGEEDIERHLARAAAKERAVRGDRNWSDLTLDDQVKIHCTSFVPYLRLRSTAVTDSIADCLAGLWDIDSGSDYHYALRALVRVWRDNHFTDDGRGSTRTLNAFLVDYDLDYRLRRIALLLRKADQLITLYNRYRGRPPEQVVLSEADTRLLHNLEELGGGVDPRGHGPGGAFYDAVLEPLHALKAGLIEIRARLVAHSCGQWQPPETADKEYTALREDLLRILKVLLGEKLPPDEQQVMATDGEPQALALPPELERLASASRTLQESVLLRARTLFDTAHVTRRTRVQAALEEGIATMQLDFGKDDGDGPTGLTLLASQVWKLLGKPIDIDESYPTVQQIAGDDTDDLPADTDLAALNTATGMALRRLMGRYYLRFDAFDQISFPLYFDTQTGEPATVEVVRVSPQDATNLIDEASDTRRKLAGTALANFGAFLDQRWRLNDAMWGRLDGVERLIQVLLPMADEHTAAIRAELIERAHGHVLRDELVPDGQGQLADLFCGAMKAMPVGTSAADVRKLLDQLALDSVRGKTRLAGILASILDERGLLAYVRDTRDIDRNPDPKTTLQNAARAVSITGRILEGISTEYGAGNAGPRWLARLGLFLQGIVAVSVPGSMRYRMFSHWVKLLYAFELFLVVLTLLFGTPAARTMAFTAIGVTVAIHVLTFIVGDMLKARSRWLRFLPWLLIAGVFGLAVLGAWHVPDYLPSFRTSLHAASG